METIRRIFFLALLSLAYSAVAQDTTGFNPSTHVATGGDLDGDGRTDLVLLPLSEPDVPFIHFSADESGNRRENLLLADVLPGGSWISGATQLAVGDVDASGVDDLVLLSNDTLYVLTFKVRNNGNLKIRVKQEQPWADLRLDGSPNDFQLILQDMDGDGHDDLILDPLTEVRDLQTVLAKENGKFKKSNRYEIRLRMDEGDTIHYGDFNGDLATDVLLQRPTRNKLKIFLSGEGIHDGVNLPDRALGFEVDAATAVIGVAQWTGDGLADLIVQQRVDPADPSDAYDIQHRALKNRGRTTNNGAPKFSECALPGIGYGPNRGGLPECYEVEGATTAKTSAKGVPAQCTSCDAGYDLTATPNPCEVGHGGGQFCASQADVTSSARASYCLFAGSTSVFCGSGSISLLIDSIPPGGMTMSIHATNDITSQQRGSLHIVHPSDLPEPPADIEFTNADFGNFTPPRTGKDNVVICWKNYNSVNATHTVERLGPNGLETVDISGMSTTPLYFGNGYQHCVSDDPRSGAFGDEGFTTQYELTLCDNGYCVENASPNPEIHFYPVNQAIQGLSVDVTHPAFSPPMDVDGTFTLSWTDPAYLQAGDYVEFGLDDVWTAATGQSQQFVVLPVDERQSVQVGVRAATTAGSIAGSEVFRTVEIQETSPPGAIGSIVLSGMSDIDPLAADDGTFSVAWGVPTGTVDSYEWTVEKYLAGSWVQVDSGSTHFTSRDVSLSQESEDVPVRFTVYAENRAGAGSAASTQVTLWKQNSQPVGQDLNLTMDEDAPLEIAFDNHVSDADGEPIHIEFLSTPKSDQGILSNNGLDWTFTPEPEYDTDEDGPITLSYIVVEDSGRKTSDPYTLTIDIFGQPDQVPFLTAAYSNQAQMDLGLVWGAANDASYYEVHWQLPNSTTDVISPVNGNLWTDTPDGVARPYGDYTFTLVACTVRGICSDVNTAPSRTLTEPVPKVGNFSVIPDNGEFGAEDYTVRWPDKTKSGIEWPNLAEYVVTEDGTEVYRGLNLEMAFSKYDQPATYAYNVRACNAQECEPVGKEYGWNVRPVGPATPLLSGGQVLASSTDFSLQVSWAQPAGRPVDVYKLHVSSGDGAWSEDVTLGAGINQHTVSGIDGSTKPFDSYNAEVSACRTIGGEELCAVAKRAYDEPRPSAPTNHVIVPNQYDEGFNERLVSEWTPSPEPNVYFYRHTIIQNGGEYRPPEDVSGYLDSNGFSLQAQPGTYRVDIAACNYSGLCSAPSMATVAVDNFVPPLPSTFTVEPVDVNTYRFDFRNAVTVDGEHPRATHHTVRWESVYYASYGQVNSQSTWEHVQDIRIEAQENIAMASRAIGDPMSTYRFSVQACANSHCSEWSPYVTVEEPTPNNILEEPEPHPPGSFAIFTEDYGDETVRNVTMLNPGYLNVVEYAFLTLRGPSPTELETVGLFTARNLGQAEINAQVVCPDNLTAEEAPYGTSKRVWVFHRTHGTTPRSGWLYTNPNDIVVNDNDYGVWERTYGTPVAHSLQCPESTEISAVLNPDVAYADESDLVFDVSWQWLGSDIPVDFFRVSWLVEREGELTVIDFEDVDFDGPPTYQPTQPPVDYLLNHRLGPDEFGRYTVKIEACRNRSPQPGFDCGEPVDMDIDEPQPPAPVVQTPAIDDDGYRIEWSKDYRNIIGYAFEETHPTAAGGVDTENVPISLAKGINDQFTVSCEDLTAGTRAYSLVAEVTTDGLDSAPVTFNKAVSGVNGYRYSCNHQGNTVTFDPAPIPAAMPAAELTGSALRETSEVGSTGGEFSVDDSGNARYSLPIMTGPSTGGMAPQISVNYSSARGHGPLGVGWSVGGISLITRCGQTVEQDGTRNTGVQMNSDDRFCLDGQRLMLVSGTDYHSNDAEYRTEIDTFSRITPAGSGNSGGGPSAFTVQRRDGTTATYGSVNGNNGVIDGFDSSDPSIVEPVFAWALTKVEDAAGNYVTYTYTEYTGNDPLSDTPVVIDYRIQKIEYAANDEAPAVAASNEIVFNYELWGNVVNGTAGPTPRYVAGRKLLSTQRLKSISSRVVGGETLREYRFSARANGDGHRRFLVDQIQECVPSASPSVPDTCFKPVNFDYHLSELRLLGVNPWGGEASVGGQGADIFPASARNIRPIQVNSDTWPDIVYSTSGSQGFEGLFVRMNQGVPTGSQNTPPTFADQIELVNRNEFNLEVGSNGSSQPIWKFADINGDGLTDILFPSGTAGHRRLIALFATDDANLYSAPTVVSDFDDIPELGLAIVDINGDGIADVVHGSGSSDGIRYNLGRGKPDQFDRYFDASRTLFISPTLFGEIITGPDTFEDITPIHRGAVDFNGDGKGDFILRVAVTGCDPNGGTICPLGPDGGPATYAVSSEAEVLNSGPTRAGDLVDEFYVVALTSETESGELIIDGYSFTESLDTTSLTCYSSPFYALKCEQLYSVQMIDINNDGLTDILYDSVSGTDPSAAVSYQYLINYGVGTENGGFSNEMSTPLLPFGEQARFMDWDGNGLIDIAFINEEPDGTYAWYVLFNETGVFPESLDGALKISTAVAGRPPSLATAGSDFDIGFFEDFSGDGVFDQLLITYHGTNASEISSSLYPGGNSYPASKGNNALKSVTNGFGAKTQVEYKKLNSDEIGFYERRFDAQDLEWGTSPVYDIESPLHVVSSVTTTAPVEGDSDNEVTLLYSYEGARIQAGGRGFLGFSSLTVTQADRVNLSNAPAGQDATSTTTEYLQNFPYTGLPRVISTIADSDDAGVDFVEVSRTVITWSTKSLHGGDVYWPYISSSYTINRDLSTGTATTCTWTFGADYDDSGNLLTQTMEYYTGEDCGPDAPISQREPFQSQVTTQEFDGDDTTGGRWWLGRISLQTITSERNDDPVRNGETESRTARYKYFSDTGLLEYERLENATDSSTLTSRYRVDRFGNRTSTTVEWARPGEPLQARTTSVEYDAAGIHANTTTNGFNQTVLSIDDRNHYGLPLEVTDAWGTTTQTLYDTMGRPYFSYTQDGSWTRTVFEDGAGTDGHCPSGTKFRQNTDMASGITTALVAVSCFDALSREIRSVSVGDSTDSGDPIMAYVDRWYDPFGNIARQTEPYFYDDPSFDTRFAYDVLDRPVVVTLPTGLKREIAYNGLTTYTRNVDLSDQLYGPVRRVTLTPVGEVSTVEDNPELASDSPYYQDFYFTQTFDGTPINDATERTSISHVYSPLGQLVSTFRPDAAETTIQYDGFDNRSYINDPDAGEVWTFHNGFGEVVCQVDAAGDAVGFVYDRLGRKTDERHSRGHAVPPTSVNVCFDAGIPEVSNSQWVYQTSGSYAPALLEESISQTGPAPNLLRDFAYDGFGRLKRIDTTIGAELYTDEYAYDQHGRPLRHVDASGRGVEYEYDAVHGALVRTGNADPANNEIYQEILSWSARGQDTELAFSNQITECRAFKDTTGQQSSAILHSRMPEDTGVCDRQGGSLEAQSSSWNIDGTLISRMRTRSGLIQNESFSYDALHRIAEVTLERNSALVNTDTYSYDKLGNLSNKAGSLLSYGNGKATQVSSIDLGGSQRGFTYDAKGNREQTINGGAIEYTVFNKPSKIEKDTAASPSTVEFAYGPNRSRYWRRVSDPSEPARNETTHIVGSVEVIVQSSGKRFRRQITPNVVSTIFDDTKVERVEVLHKDHLGSVSAISDEAGTLTYLSYDIWGQRRDAGDWQQSVTALPTLTNITNRGFTGHEMLDGVNLIHMNGRVYDPQVGRFLTADPFVQFPHNGQSHNRYTYVLNNPVMYTDPSGYYTDFGIFSSIIVSSAVATVLENVQYQIEQDDRQEHIYSQDHGTLSGAFDQNPNYALFGFDEVPPLLVTYRSGGECAGSMSSMCHDFIRDLNEPAETVPGNIFIFMAFLHGDAKPLEMLLTQAAVDGTHAGAGIIIPGYKCAREGCGFFEWSFEAATVIPAGRPLRFIKGVRLSQLRSLRSLGVNRTARREFFEGKVVEFRFPTSAGDDVFGFVNLDGDTLVSQIFSINNTAGGAPQAFRKFLVDSKALAKNLGLTKVELQGGSLINSDLAEALLNRGFSPKKVAIPDALGGGTQEVLFKVIDVGN